MPPTKRHNSKTGSHIFIQGGKHESVESRGGKRKIRSIKVTYKNSKIKKSTKTITRNKAGNKLKKPIISSHSKRRTTKYIERRRA